MQNNEWKRLEEYTLHDADHISGFFGPYGWLSNFEKTKVKYDGLTYPSSENAFQAAKIIPSQREDFIYCSPAESKELWKKDCYSKLYSAQDWDKVKYDVMLQVNMSKFLTNKTLREKLVNTGQAKLIEKNHWGDTTWGVNLEGSGENALGEILMAIRAALLKYRF